MAESCKPCEEDNKKTASDGFCRECEEHMCKTCFRHHLKARYCRNHELLPLTPKHDNKSVIRVDQCEKHDKQPVTYYCRKHEQVGCGDCMLFDGHNECKPENIKRLTSNIQEQEAFVSVTAKLKMLSCLNEVNTKQLHENRRYSTELTGKLLESVGGFRAMVDSYLDKAEEDVRAQAEKIHKENDELLNTLEEDCCSTDTLIKECQQQLSSTHLPNQALFINLVNIKPKVSRIEERIPKTKKSTKIDQYIFKPDMKLTEVIESQRSLGTFEKNIEKANSVTKHIRKGQNNNGHGTDTLKPIQIFIRTFLNNTLKTYTVSPTETIKKLKRSLSDKEGIPVDQMQLQTAFTGKTLRDEFRIYDYDIHEGSTLICCLIVKLNQTSKNQ